MIGDDELARSGYLAAAALTDSEPEKAYLKQRAAQTPG
jgi:hypothetical protein